MTQKIAEQSGLQQALIAANLLTAKQVEEIRAYATGSGISLEQAILEKHLVPHGQLGQIISNLNGWRFVDLETAKIDLEIAGLVPETLARRHDVVAFGKNIDGFQVAMHNPNDQQTINILSEALGGEIIPYFSTLGSILKMTQLLGQASASGSQFQKLIESYTHEATVGNAKESAIVQIVDLLLGQGYMRKASDIHIEPGRTYTAIRMRIDGVLHEAATMPRYIHDLIVTRIKILSKMRTDEHRVPQDGKFQYELEGKLVDIRVSVVPAYEGETAVLRLLIEQEVGFSIDALGFSPADRAKMMRNIKKPWGMILATGPTGSGKTTTLYAILNMLNSPESKIITIEDPVEYNLAGVTQIQVNPHVNLTFAEGLRAIVRQDPDIIMVGEIRDEESASIAINAAMTGHVVLSTMHTIDSATTLPRFLDMGTKPFLVASTVNVAIGQRLVRKICEQCKMQYTFSSDDIKTKGQEPVFKTLLEMKNPLTLFKGTGCKQCQHTGFKGRIGIFEVLEMGDEIGALIMEHADARTIEKKALELGMTSMLHDAAEKILQGLTTPEEVARVIKQ